MSGHALDGVRIVVTGAASGIGQATADELRSRGAQVIGLDRAADDSPAARILAADVTDDAAVRTAIDEVTESLGGLDAVVCAAGIDHLGSVSETTDETWHRLYDINVVGAVRVVRAALPHLKESDNASIVLISSALAHLGVVNRTAYSATKGALTATVRALAAELAADGIRVNSVSPGSTDTPMLSLVTPLSGGLDALAERQPLKRLFQPREIGVAVAYLLDAASGPITGSDFVVDGGLTSLRLPTPQK